MYNSSGICDLLRGLTQLAASLAGLRGYSNRVGTVTLINGDMQLASLWACADLNKVACFISFQTLSAS